MLMLIVLLALWLTPAFGRDNGQWAEADPALKEWIEGLTDKNQKNCCNTADGFEVEDWTLARPAAVPANAHVGHKGYWVKYHGGWLPVPDEALLDVPNKLGYARVWVRYENGNPIVRCFLRGIEG